MDRMKMGNFLTELRKEKDLSQTDLAEIIGVTFQAVSKWERGEAIPDISILEKLASFYNVSIDEIIKGEAVGRPNPSVQPMIHNTSTISNNSENAKGFLNQKRVFGFWFSLAYLIVYILFGFCPFAKALIYTSTHTTVYVVSNYYKFIFSSDFQMWNFFLLIQLLTTLAIIAFTMLFYVCTTKKALRAMFNTRFVLIIINLATLIMNIAIVSDSSLQASAGNYLILLTILIFDILLLCLKPNRKSYILQDYK